MDIHTEDGVVLHEGDAAYDYYSMLPGHIGRMAMMWVVTVDAI
jgi:hypothetical protein